MAKRKVFEAVINAAQELRKLGGTQAERMARAAEQGSTIPAYHGGDGGVMDFTPGSNRGSMGAAYFNDNIRNAYRYAYGGGIDEGRPLREYRDLQREQLPDRNPVVQKVLLRMQKPLSPSDVTSDMVINALGRDKVISLLDNDYSFAAHIDENFEGSKKAFLSDDSNLRDWMDRYDDEGAAILEHDNEAIGSDRSGPFVFAHINGLLKDVVSKNGFDGFKFYDNEMGGITYVPLEPNQIRSINADFNPEYKDSSNILAGITGAMPYAAGTAALLSGVAPEEAEAGALQTLGRAAPYLTSAALGGAAALQSGDAEAGIITRGGRRLIEAWHGSPHSFDKFDMSKIGTGEGNQSYGHGLYLADVKDDARQYMRPGRHQYTSETTIDGSPISRANPQNPVEAQAINALRRNPTIDEAVKYLQQDEGTEAAQAWLSENRQRIQDAHSTGLLYRTEIDVDPDTLLDYDKPLSEQSDHVRGILSQWQKDVGGSIGTGDGALKEIAFDRRMRGLDDSPQAVSQQLRDMGIPGIRYLDNQSRQAGEGTYNYVMFDDKPISIVERGNATPALLATTAVGTGAGMYAASDAEAGPLDALGRAAPYLATGALGAAMMTPQDAQAGGMPEYEQRLSQIPYPNIDNGDGSRSTHEMAVEVDDNGNWFAFPTIQPGDNGQLQRFELRDAQQRAMATGNYKAFGQDKDAALQYGSGGYKVGTNIDPNTPPQIDFNRYMDVMGRTNAAMNKIDQFKAKRAGKRGAMDIMKLELQTLLKGANEVANDVIFPALDKPLQGYLGLSEVFGSLAQGRGFDAAMQRGAQVATQPVDTTTYNMGGTVTDSLSPYVPAPVAAGAGALTHAGALLASPF